MYAHQVFVITQQSNIPREHKPSQSCRHPSHHRSNNFWNVLYSYAVACWNIENINQTRLALAWGALALKISPMTQEMREAFVEESEDSCERPVGARTANPTTHRLVRCLLPFCLI